MLKIEIVQGYAEAKYGVVIVLDLYSFSTTATVIGSRRVEDFFCMGGEYEDAKRLRGMLGSDVILVDDAVVEESAESWEMYPNPLPFYYLKRVLGREFGESRFLYRSVNGSQMVSGAAKMGKEVFVGALINMNRLREVLLLEGIGEVSIVCAGSHGKPLNEDSKAAEYLRDYLLGGAHDDAKYWQMIREIVVAEGEMEHWRRNYAGENVCFGGFNLWRSGLSTVLRGVLREDLGPGVVQLKDG